MKYLSLLLAWAFFIQPITVTSSGRLTSGGIAYAQSTKCSSGQVYNTQLNRCIVTQKTLSARNEALECDGLDGDAYTECFKNNAKRRSDEVNSETGEIKQTKGRTLIPLTVTLTAGYYLWKHRNAYKNCSALSMKLIAAGAVAALVGEVISHMQHKSRSKKVEDKYKEEVEKYNSEKGSEDRDKHQSMSQNQVIAFDYLIESEESAIKGEKTRKVAHTIASGLYISATIAAGLEVYRASTGDVSTRCNPTVTANKRYYDQSVKDLALSDEYFTQFAHIKNITAEEIEESIFRKIFSSIIPSAHADGTKSLLPIMGLLTAATTIFPLLKSTSGGTEVNIAQKSLAPSQQAASQQNQFARFLTQPWTRLAISGVMSGYSITLMKEAGENIKIYKDRVEKIKEIKNGFISSGGTGGVKLCGEQECFKKTQVQDAIDWNARYTAKDQIPGCLNKQGQIDSECRCKRQKAQNGQNNCQNISGSFKIGNLGASSFSAPFVSAANKLTTGNLSASNLAAASLYKKIAALNKKRNQLFEKNKDLKKALKKANKLGLKIQKSHSNYAKKVLQNSPPLPVFTSSNTISGNKEFSKALLSLKNKIEAPKFTQGKETKKLNPNNDLDFDFSDDASGSIEIDDVTTLMDKEFKIDGDINKNSSQDIFKILSIRYQRSGLRRLFDSKGDSSVDEANSAEINGL